MSEQNGDETVGANGESASETEEPCSSSSSEDMNAYKKSALSVTTFKLIYEKEDVTSNDGVTFKPIMSHQVFGDNESIFGFKHLSITLYYHHNSSKCFVDVQASGKIKNKNVGPDDIMEQLNEWLPGNYVTNKKQFLENIKDDSSDTMCGEVVGTFQGNSPVEVTLAGHTDPVYPTFKVCQCDMKDELFKEYHSRFETFIVWFIDAANFIDLDDDKWQIFYVYEEFTHPKTNKLYRTPVGFCSIYKFFAYPDKVRARISQFIILPSHQKKGVGRQFYHLIAKTLRNTANVVDITTEDPTQEFQKIRDIDESLLVNDEINQKEYKLLTTSTKLIFEVMRNLKICKKRQQRVMDILACAHAKNNGVVDHRTYLNRIKNRIKDQTEREHKPGKRFCGVERQMVADLDLEIETEYKKYIEEIEPSVLTLKKLLYNV